MMMYYLIYGVFHFVVGLMTMRYIWEKYPGNDMDRILVFILGMIWPILLCGKIIAGILRFILPDSNKKRMWWENDYK